MYHTVKEWWLNRMSFNSALSYQDWTNCIKILGTVLSLLTMDGIPFLVDHKPYWDFTCCHYAQSLLLKQKRPNLLNFIVSAFTDFSF